LNPRDFNTFRHSRDYSFELAKVVLHHFYPQRMRIRDIYDIIPILFNDGYEYWCNISDESWGNYVTQAAKNGVIQNVQGGHGYFLDRDSSDASTNSDPTGTLSGAHENRDSMSRPNSNSILYNGQRVAAAGVQGGRGRCVPTNHNIEKSIDSCLKNFAGDHDPEDITGFKSWLKDEGGLTEGNANAQAYPFGSMQFGCNKITKDLIRLFADYPNSDDALNALGNYIADDYTHVPVNLIDVYVLGQISRMECNGVRLFSNDGKYI
jgi:hypothetical protein